MTNENPIRISEEVREAIGEKVAEEILTSGHGDFTCLVCQMEGSTIKGDIVNVVAVLHPNTSLIRMGHETCIASTILTTDTPFEPRSSPVEEDVLTLAMTYTMPGKGPTAILIFDRPSGLRLINPSGDTVDPWFTELLSVGWELSASGLAWGPRVPRWKLMFDKRQQAGEIFTAEKLPFLDNLPSLPYSWADVAARKKEILVLAGTDIGLDDIDHAEEAAVRAALKAAALKGKLLTGRIQVSLVNRPSPAQPDQLTQTRAKLAKGLKDAMQERARPNQSGAGNLNDAPDLAALPARPRLTPSMVGEFPVLIVDLAAPPEQQHAVEELMRKLGHEGLAPFTAWDGGPLAMPPKEWGYVLWPSQVLIMAGKSDDRMRKLLFEPLVPAHEWYQAVKKSVQGSMGLMIGNLNIPDLGTDEGQAMFEQRMKDGDVLGCALTGMCTT